MGDRLQRSVVAYLTRGTLVARQSILFIVCCVHQRSPAWSQVGCHEVDSARRPNPETRTADFRPENDLTRRHNNVFSPSLRGNTVPETNNACYSEIS